MQVNDELLEVVDDTGRFLRTATRAECHSDPSLIHRSVCVLILNNAHRILLQKRSHTKDLYPGLWDLSATGHVCAGETWDEAARRELEEELGIQASLKFAGTVLVREARETELAAIFICRHDGPIQPHPDEIDDCRFLPPAEASGLPDLTKYARTILGWVSLS